jgi:hypothetical protein
VAIGYTKPLFGQPRFGTSDFVGLSRITMASSDTVTGVLEFLASYRRAFESYDCDAIVSHYRFPCHVLSDAEHIALTAVADPEQLKAAVERVLSLHREIGVPAAVAGGDRLVAQTGRIDAPLSNARRRGEAALRLSGILFAADIR